MERRTQWAHATELPVDAVSAARAREFVIEHLHAHGLSHLIADVQLVASELATNALTHARTPFTVALESAENSVVLTVRDGAPGRPTPARPRHLDVRGRGIAIVQVLSGSWGVDVDAGGGKSVWAAFDI